MSFTYSPNDISTDLAKVRLLIRDTSTATNWFQDEEINFILDEESTIYGAARTLLRSRAAEVSGKVNKSVGKLRIDLSDQYKHLTELADKYEAMAKVKGTPSIFAGGISVATKNTEDADTDRVTPVFRAGMFDLPGTITSSTQVS